MTRADSDPGRFLVTGGGRQALSGGEDGTLRLWDLASDQELRTFTGHAGSVRAVAVTPNGPNSIGPSVRHVVKSNSSVIPGSSGRSYARASRTAVSDGPNTGTWGCGAFG